MENGMMSLNIKGDVPTNLAERAVTALEKIADNAQAQTNSLSMIADPLSGMVTEVTKGVKQMFDQNNQK